MRIFVGYGQFGLLFSPSIAMLARKLAPYGDVTTHNWRDLGYQVAAYVKTYGGGQVCVVGYSLSASMLEWISDNIRHNIKLGIAIDPTQLFATAKWNEDLKVYTQRASRFDTVICFWNKNAKPFGGARYIGTNVKLYPIDTFHLLAQAVPQVWDVTQKAVAAAGR